MTLRCPLAAWAAIMLVLATAVNTAWAQQDRIPPDIMMAEPPWTPEQQQTLDDYLDDWFARLLNGTAEEVSAARDKLIDPVNQPGVSDEFQNRYADGLLDRLERAMQSDQLITRLNAIILITRLQSGQARQVGENDEDEQDQRRAERLLRLIEQALEDESPAVRYWAAKAVSQIASEGLDVDDQLTLLRLLEQTLKREPATAVINRLLSALNALRVPEAKRVLLGVLDARVEQHARQPMLELQAVQEVMRALFQSLVQAKARGEPVDDLLKELARVAFRYMGASLLHIMYVDVPRELRQEKRAMVELGDNVLRFILDQLAPGTRPPEEITNALRQQDWPFIKVQVDRWVRSLGESPFHFTRPELQYDFGGIVPEDAEPAPGEAPAGEPGEAPAIPGIEPAEPAASADQNGSITDTETPPSPPAQPAAP